MTDLRKLAKGKPCMVRSPMCDFDPATSVLAHLNGAGIGLKHSDWLGAWCCAKCHTVVDGPLEGFPEDWRQFLLLWGIIRTQRELFDRGITPEMPVKRQRSSKILPRNGF